MFLTIHRFTTINTEHWATFYCIGQKLTIEFVNLLSINILLSVCIVWRANAKCQYDDRKQSATKTFSFVRLLFLKILFSQLYARLDLSYPISNTFSVTARRLRTAIEVVYDWFSTFLGVRNPGNFHDKYWLYLHNYLRRNSSDILTIRSYVSGAPDGHVSGNSPRSPVR